MKNKSSEKPNYNYDIQKLYLEFFLSDAETFARCQNIFDSENFDKRLKNVAEFIWAYVDEYRTMPELSIVNAVCNSDLVQKNVTEDIHSWLMDEFEQFTRHKSLERAILKSAEMLEKGDYTPVEKIIKDAIQISLNRDMGTDYFENPKGRLDKLRDRNGLISTGWPSVDRKLFGGMKRGDLNIFAAASGGGKSLFLANLAVNWATSGLNVIYLTFELSEELVCMRLDSMMTGISTKEVFKNLDDVELKVKMLQKKSGNIRVKYMPSGKNCNDIRAYLKEYQVKTGLKPDVILIDYLDLMMPISVKVSPSDLYIKDKYVSEEIRNLAMEQKCLTVTASQLNRCLTLDTKVVANGREIEIKDVQVGDWLDSNKGPVQVYEKLPVTKQKVYKIKTKSGKEIICSGNHKFPVGNTLKTINSGLKKGDILRSRIDKK